MKHSIRIWKIGSFVAVITIAVLLTTCGDAGEPTQPGGSNANLDDLTLSSGSLSPVFTADTSTYSAFIDSVTGSITVTPTTSSSKAKCEVRCDGGSWAEVLSGSTCSSLTMNIGPNTVEVRVTAEDGTTTKVYVITAYRGILVPDEYSKIQDAIDAAADGDWVLVRAGTYPENIEFPTDGRSITVRSTHGPGNTTIDGGSNGLCVVTFSTSGASMALDGFTITNGHNTNPAPQGGGIDILQSSPTITNCVISSNSTQSAGGGIYCNNASPTINNCSFIENTSFLINTVGVGGGMCNLSSSPTVTNCTFEGNNAADNGGGMCNLSSSPTVTDCTFSENTAYNRGGGMYNLDSSPMVTGCTFSGNTSTMGLGGGGMFNDGAGFIPIVTGCTFSKNTAPNGEGGGIYNFDSSATVANCIFYLNTRDPGRDMVNNGSSASPTITNCTFKNLNNSMHNQNFSTPTVTNCILWGGGYEMIFNFPNGSPVVNYCNLEGGYPFGGTGNINEDPMFVDEANGDLHLQSSSPCIDAGDNDAQALPTTDIDGDDRKIDDPTVPDTGNGTPPIVDMGADEYAG